MPPQHMLLREAAPAARLRTPPLQRRCARARLSPPRAAKGFGGKGAAPKAHEEVPTELLDVDLGGGKSLKLLRAQELLDTNDFSLSAETVTRLQSLYGAGDVIWPASLAMARLLAHCPSFVAGRRVLELGAGLGLVGCAAVSAGAASLLLADRDGATLALAARSAALNAPPGLRVGTLVADWSGSFDAWPTSDDVDLVLASDILYDASAAAPVAALLARTLKPRRGGAAAAEAAHPRRALLADAPQRLNRDAFIAACASHGLDAQCTVIPGPEGTMLLNVVVAA